MDLPGAEEWLKKIVEELEPLGYEIYPISAATMEGINKLKFAMWDAISNIKPEYETFDEEMEITLEEPEEETIIVKKENGKYIVEGSYVDRLIHSINFDDLDSLRYFQNIMRQKGIIEELEKLGIEDNDTVFICGYEFEFFD